MCDDLTCRDCLFCSGLVHGGKMPPLCLYTCEATTLETVACEHFGSKNEYRTYIKRCIRFWTTRLGEHLSGAEGAEGITRRVSEANRVARIAHKEDYVRPKD